MSVLIIQADARHMPLADTSVQCCVTSPPYWGLRDYGVSGQLGLEKTPEEYIASMVDVFREVKRVLRNDGTLWLNIGDSYAGSGKGPSNSLSRPHQCMSNVEAAPKGWLSVPNNCKPKDLVGVPWMLAFALRADGWYLRSDIIWSKPNPMPESVTDRPTKAHEYIFLFSKSERYFYNADAIAEKSNWPEGSWGRSKCYDGDTTGKLRSFYGNGAQWLGGETRNKRTVWEVATSPFSEAHFATFPEELIKPCILAGCPHGGIVLDPFIGSGTTALVAQNLQCDAVGLELNPAYIQIAKRRLAQEVLSF